MTLPRHRMNAAEVDENDHFTNHCIAASDWGLSALFPHAGTMLWDKRGFEDAAQGAGAETRSGFPQEIAQVEASATETAC